MPASTRRRPASIAVAPALELEQVPSRYWGLALTAACAASWAAIIAAAKLLLALT